MNSYSVYLLSLQTVTMDNAEEYVDLMFDFCMHTGIQKQMEAFRGNCKYNIFEVRWDNGCLGHAGLKWWLSKINFLLKNAIGKILISEHLCISYAVFNCEDVPFNLIKKLLIDCGLTKIQLKW